MKANYENWMPKNLIFSSFAACLISAYLAYEGYVKEMKALTILFAIVTLLLLALTCWGILLYRAFSYDGKRQLSRQIIEGTASYLKDIKGDILDVGCGSGALAIAVAKNNPDANIFGVDRWGREYAAFSKALCEENARIEGVANTCFIEGNAVRLLYEDERFDAIVSNYVYHNITGVNKQELILESLRTLKKGGTFVIHDVMSKRRFGNMEGFAKKLKAIGYQDVRLIRTDDGLFMTKAEARLYGLTGSTILIGIK
ncbi:methyltransferase domain-containing protein [Lachnospira pectinoschiza]|uniref:Methyltransferase domain-containing protein n=1 Tax=Lachnospira pectinoschiza TaxID=28052 RepID=A0A1G9TK81_9FIRM|nr:class I SAM-dependent methyltransferase [Lachnospira pectinoschiza]SDM47978.1 Methyltransferase domain-containing protein [Lachnospira pectinoschiza]